MTRPFSSSAAQTPMRPGAGATHAGPLILVMRFRFRSSSKRAPGSMLRACCQTDGEGMATLLTDVSTTRVRSTGRSASMTTGAWPSARGLSGRRQWASTLKRVSDSSTGSTPGAPRLRAARISRAALVVAGTAQQEGGSGAQGLERVDGLKRVLLAGRIGRGLGAGEHKHSGGTSCVVNYQINWESIIEACAVLSW